MLGGEGEVVRQGEQVAHVPVGAEAAERLAGVLHEEVCGEEAAEDADVGLKNLHRVGLVEVDVVDDELHGAPELGCVAHDGERVEGVDEGEGVVAQDVVDVDVVGVGHVGAAAEAVDLRLVF